MLHARGSRAITAVATVAGALVASVVVVPMAVHAADETSAKIELRANLPKGAQPTKRKPSPVTLDARMIWTDNREGEEHTLQKTTVLFPPGSIYNGAKLPTCREENLNARGVSGCPKGSVMGKGRAIGDADGVITVAQITVVNGGADKVFFYTTMTNPAVVQLAVVGHIRKLKGPWAYELVSEIPTELQVVAGVPIVVRDLKIQISNKKWLAVDRPPTAISVHNVLAPPHA